MRAVSFNYARTERRFFDKELEADFRALEAAAPDGAEVSIASRTRDEQTWLVAPRSGIPPHISPYLPTSGSTEGPKSLEAEDVFLHAN